MIARDPEIPCLCEGAHVPLVGFESIGDMECLGVCGEHALVVSIRVVHLPRLITLVLSDRAIAESGSPSRMR